MNACQLHNIDARPLPGSCCTPHPATKPHREKFIKGRLEELEQRQAREGQGAGEGSGEEGDGGDEEEEREVWMLQADLAALQVRIVGLRSGCLHGW